MFNYRNEADDDQLSEVDDDDVSVQNISEESHSVMIEFVEGQRELFDPSDIKKIKSG